MIKKLTLLPVLNIAFLGRRLYLLTTVSKKLFIKFNTKRLKINTTHSSNPQ